MEEATQSSGQQNKIVLIAGVVILLALAGSTYVFLNSNKTAPTTQSATISATKEIITFAVEGKPFAFTPSEIKVKKGDTVKIVFTNKAGFHDWALDEFNAKTKQINAGQTDEVTFTADKIGTFEYYCSVVNHRQQGMVGKLIVE